MFYKCIQIYIDTPYELEILLKIAYHILMLILNDFVSAAVEYR
jgi:hypothetical protein